MRRLLLLLAACTLVAAACGDDEGGGDSEGLSLDRNAEEEEMPAEEEERPAEEEASSSGGSSADMYADDICGAFNANLVPGMQEFATGFGGLADTEPATVEEADMLFDQATAGLEVFDMALTDTVNGVEGVTPADVEGGAEFHEAVVSTFSGAQMAAADAVTLFRDFDVINATPTDATEFQAELERLSPAFDSLGSELEGAPPEIDIAIAGSSVCSETEAAFEELDAQLS